MDERTCGNIDGKGTACEFRLDAARCPKAMTNYAVTVTDATGRLIEISPTTTFFPADDAIACSPMVALSESRARVAKLEDEVERWKMACKKTSASAIAMSRRCFPTQAQEE